MSDTNEIEQLSLVQQVASLRLARETEAKIAEKLGMTRHRVRKVLQSQEYKDFLKELGDSAIEDIRNAVRSNLKSLEPHFWSALEYQLKTKKSMQAVVHFSELSGLKKVDEEKQADTSIQILLPGQRPTEIIIPNEVKESEDDSSES